MPTDDRATALRRPLLTLAAVLLVGAAPERAFAELASLLPRADATLVESPTGALANGVGPAIFAGRVASSPQSLRRAAIEFDVAGALPPGATITSVRLRLGMSATSGGPAAVTVHRLRAAWGEGPSSASGGGAAASLPGDVTWRHRFYDHLFWAAPGGDFEPVAGAAAIVDQPGAYVWGSTPGLVADVQEWLDLPDRNFGWILLGDESQPQTVKRFDSRESPDPTLRPVLEVVYSPLCDPMPAGLGYWRRQCGASWNEAAAGAPTSPGGECAARIGSALLLPPFDPCAAVLADPPLACEERANRSLAVLILNVCAGRLQTTCDASREDASCLSTTVGDRLFEVAALLRAGDCRRAASCAAIPE